MVGKTFAEEMADDAERGRRQMVHAMRPREPLSMDQGVDLHRQMEGTPETTELSAVFERKR
jgi:hypothetical protein